MHCEQCGAPVGNGVRFCSKCGAELNPGGAAGAHASASSSPAEASAGTPPPPAAQGFPRTGAAYCRHCGRPVLPLTEVCPYCGRRIWLGTRFCQACGTELPPLATACSRCGTPQTAYSNKNWVVALVLSIVVGTLGVDRFYLGYIGWGILKLVTFGALGVWWLVDLILIAMNRIPDANGLPLRQ